MNRLTGRGYNLLDLALGGIGTESAEINSTGQKLLKLCVAAPAGAVSVTTRILML
jgi:hypothetical protein